MSETGNGKEDAPRPDVRGGERLVDGIVRLLHTPGWQEDEDLARAILAAVVAEFDDCTIPKTPGHLERSLRIVGNGGTPLTYVDRIKKTRDGIWPGSYTTHVAGDMCVMADCLAAMREASARRTPGEDGVSPSLDEVYAERNKVVLAFAALVKEQGWDVGLTVDPSSPDWPVLMIETDAGQVSWHFQAGELPPGLPLFAGKWDGHSTPEKYARLAELVRSAFGLSREIAQDGDTEETT